MAFSAQSNVSSLSLGKLLKILSRGAVYNQLSAACEAWDHVKQIKGDDAEGREYRYEVMTDYGPAAVQASGYGSTAKFPKGQRSNVQEAVAQYKDFDMTIEYDLTLEEKAGKELVAYAKPLAHEMNAKGIVASRIASAWLFGDGSGSIGVVGSAGVTVDTTNDKITVPISTISADGGKSHVGWFEYNDKVKFASQAGVAHNTINNAGTTVSYWLVTDVDQDDDTVDLQPYDSNDALINISSATIGATDPTAADSIYRFGTTANDLTAISTNDYNTLSEVMVGLDSLGANDGRKVNGLTLSGVLGGSQEDGDGQLLSGDMFTNLLLRAHRRTGGMTDGKKISYSTAWMHDRVYALCIKQAEANRQFFNTQDVNTGVSKVGHKFKETMVQFKCSEYVPIPRVHLLPDAKGPLEFSGRDFRDVTLGGKGIFLKPAGDGQYYKQGQKFLSGAGVLASRHPAALASIRNFIIAV